MQYAYIYYICKSVIYNYVYIYYSKLWIIIISEVKCNSLGNVVLNCGKTRPVLRDTSPSWIYYSSIVVLMVSRVYYTIYILPIYYIYINTYLLYTWIYTHITILYKYKQLYITHGFCKVHVLYACYDQFPLQYVLRQVTVRIKN